jgi:hypothetical protein
MKAKLTFVVTNDDGSPFSSTTQEWDGLDRAQSNWLEGQGLAFLKGLNDFGAQEAAKKVGGATKP